MARENRVRLSDEEVEKVDRAKVALYGRDAAEEVSRGKAIGRLAGRVLDDGGPGKWEARKTDNGFLKGNVPPGMGGCWFCHSDDAELEFSQEFDTYYHEECAELAGVAEYDDPVLAYERGDGDD